MASVGKLEKLFLNKEVSIQDLNQGVEFEVDCEHYSDSEEEDYFDKEEFNTFKEDVANMDSDEYKPELLGGANVPFSVLKERMEPVTEDQKILKEVIKFGAGSLIPNKSIILMHYDAYIENQSEPFDSTRLRRRPFKFLFGDGNVLPGLELGIKTMKKNEMSRFIVSPEYAYGAMGCPPRIPPSCEILYEVEILNLYDTKEAIEFEDMTMEEQKKASFEKVTAAYHCDHQMANDLFHRKQYKQAIARYHKIANMLENVSVANEEEDDKRKSYLLKIYSNLAQCYLNVQNPNKAIIYSDLALKLDDENPKALFRMGYALYLTDDSERAEYYLTKAKQYKPYEKSVNDAIAKLEIKRKQHLDWEKLFCRKMFSSENGSEKKRVLLESPEFIEEIENQIKTFIESDEKELSFSSGYTENQIDVVKELAKNYNLAYVTKIMCGTKINKIVKRA